MYKRVVGDSTRLGYMEIRKRRYIGRIVALLLTMPLVVFVALLTLLYLPPVQRWAVEKAAHVASDATGFDSFGQYCTATYCATTASSKGTLRNCAQQCNDIAGYMISAPSELSNLLNFSNLWEYYDQSRRINISCPKLKWEK